LTLCAHTCYLILEVKFHFSKWKSLNPRNYQNEERRD